MDTDTLLTPAVLVPIAAVVVVLLGVAIAIVTMTMKKARLQKLDRWARGAYAIWTGGEDCASWPMQRAQDSLKNWYGATTGTMLLDTVRELRAGTTGNAAWDKVRALDLLRIGLAAKYIDEEQARNEAAILGGELQRQYRSWEELAQAFEAGMQSWQRSRGVSDGAELGRVQKNLPALRQQIWPQIAFDAPLVAGD